MAMHASYNPLPCERYVPDLEISDLDFSKYIIDKIDKDIL